MSKRVTVYHKTFIWALWQEAQQLDLPDTAYIHWLWLWSEGQATLDGFYALAQAHYQQTAMEVLA